MSRVTFVLFVLVAVVFAMTNGYPDRRCGPNQTWTNCGTACPLSCEYPKPRPCILLCVPGCQCRQGLVKFGDRCIWPYECPRRG